MEYGGPLIQNDLYSYKKTRRGMKRETQRRKEGRPYEHITVREGRDWVMCLQDKCCQRHQRMRERHEADSLFEISARGQGPVILIWKLLA